jgi:hypothetical protein
MAIGLVRHDAPAVWLALRDEPCGQRPAQVGRPNGPDVGDGHIFAVLDLPRFPTVAGRFFAFGGFGRTSARSRDRDASTP